MGTPSLDLYSARCGPVHRLPAMAKFAATLAIVAATVVLPSWIDWWPAAAAGIVAGAAVMSRLPLTFILKRLLLIEPFIVGVALLSLLQPSGLRIFAMTITKSTICVLAMILLAGTTPLGDLLGALRKLRVPGIFITVLALTSRYIHVLVDETARMRRARASRTFSGGQRRTWRMLADIAARLFVRSSERAERIYAAMSARGWRV